MRTRRPELGRSATCLTYRLCTGLDGSPDLIEGDLRLGLEGDTFGNARLGTPRGIRGPGFGKIEPKGHGKARLFVGDRQRHGDLAVVLLAELSAVLPSYADRMGSLLRKPGIVDNPGTDGFGLRDRRKDEVA